MEAKLQNTKQFNDIVCRLYFIRHAESQNNYMQSYVSVEEYVKQRKSDPDLSPRGELQLQALLHELNHRGIVPDRIYCSCLLRALRTAEIIWKHFDGKQGQSSEQSAVEKSATELQKKCKVEVRPEISEKNFLYQGKQIFKGNPRSWFLENFPYFQIPETITEEGWNAHQDHFESNQECIKRAENVIEWLHSVSKVSTTEQSTEDHIPTYIIITHGNFSNEIMSLLLGCSQKSYSTRPMVKYLKNENTALTHFDIQRSGEWHLDYFNDYQHLQLYNLDQQILKRLPEVGGSLLQQQTIIKTDQGLL